MVTQPRLLLGPPLPLGATSDGEVVDLLLPAPLTAGDLLTHLVPALPVEQELVAIHDVWVGEPTLPAHVCAADYRVTVDARGVDIARLDVAITAALASPSIARERGEQRRPGNLRPLILDIRRMPDDDGPEARTPDHDGPEARTPDDVDPGRAAPRSGAGEPSAGARTQAATEPGERRPDTGDMPGGPAVASLWMRLQIDPALGSGRPDEVLAAISRAIDTPVRAMSLHRERLWFRDEGVCPPTDAVDAKRGVGAAGRSRAAPRSRQP